MRADKKRVSLDSPGMLRIRNVISHAREPLDGEEIAKRAHVGVRTFSASYQQILLDEGLMHIADYRRNTRGPFIPLFAFGPLIGKPAEKPKKLTEAEICKRWKEKTGYDELRKLNRKLVRPPDGLFAALMGLPARGKHFKDHHNRAGQAPAEGNTAP